MFSKAKTYMILVCVVLLTALVSCAPGTEEYSKKKEDPLPDEIGHELELVSSVWGFGTTNNSVLSADTGFFCISRDDTGIYPTLYDPETIQKKSLGTDVLLPYFEGYQVFTAGDRLIACTEDNSMINIISPPYEEVSASHILKDRDGNVWHIHMESAIVFDRENDAVYCSLAENDSYMDKPVLLACIDLDTGLVTPVLRSEPEEFLTLFACDPSGMLVLMGGRNHSLKQMGQTKTVLFDLKKSQVMLHYSGETLDLQDKQYYSGYAFGDDGVYYSGGGGVLKKYSYADGSVSELCFLSGYKNIPSQILTDGKIHFSLGYPSSEDPNAPNWYDTVSGELFSFRFVSNDGRKLSNPSKGFSGECGKWYCLIEYGPSSSISDNKYVLVDKQEYWTGTADVIRFD